MTAGTEGTHPSAQVAWVDGAPVSPQFDDVYFSRQDGLAEARAVFLAGCGLPDAWQGRARFTVAELGFGTGLNIAALLDLWRRSRDPAAHLSIFSVEAHPLSRADAARALAAWPELSEPADALLRDWSRGRRGFHRFDLDGFHATLDLYVGEVADALAAWTGPADAWFLDGFAPARNPAMWSEAVLAAVGRLSAPGATTATFTVAGAVRRGLAAAGFEVAKRPGHGAKHERLEAWLPGPRVAPTPGVGRLVVVGGGIAGAALARAAARIGLACVLVEAQAPGAGASGNPAALVTPRLDAGLGPVAELHAQAFHRAVDLYRRDAPGAILGEGALQLARSPKDEARFAHVAGWDRFDPGALTLLDAEAAGNALGEALEDEAIGAVSTSPPGALAMPQALIVNPAHILAAWLAEARPVSGVVAEVVRSGDGWTCLDAQGRVLAEGDAVCIASGVASALLAGLSPLQPVRGQLEYTQADVFDGLAAAWGAYAVPLADGGALFGASHRRGDVDTAWRAQERAANLVELSSRRPRLAARIEALPGGALRSRVSIRAATADHLPLAGIVRPALGVLAGLGGRGFTLAPLLAEHVIAGLVGAPSPLSPALAARLRPERFDTAKPNLANAVRSS